MADQLTIQVVADVGIVAGCILCGQCEALCPQVFSLRVEGAMVRRTAEQYYRTHALAIIRAAKECPAGVIRVRPVASPNR